MTQKVELIALSKPSAVTGCTSANELIAYTARVSNPDNQMNTETAPRLIRYLIKQEHWSPFEMVHMTIGITTTRDIGRQLLRHRSFSFQEFSQRYAVATDFITDREARLQDPKNRQNSIKSDNRRLQENFNGMQNVVKASAMQAYKWSLDNGIAKEQARAVLPEGLTETTIYVAGTLRSWLHYCLLRMENGTQLEHAELAAQCYDIISWHFPDVVAAIAEIKKDEEVQKELMQLLYSEYEVKSAQELLVKLAKGSADE